MYYFKGCPKCKGDLYEEEDFYGSYFKCLQCGVIIDIETREMGAAKKIAAAKEKLAA